jgi:hypothetical protein
VMVPCMPTWWCGGKRVKSPLQEVKGASTSFAVRESQVLKTKAKQRSHLQHLCRARSYTSG